MTEAALNILQQVYLNVILGVVPCEPEDEDAREEVFTDYIAETVVAMVSAGDMSAIDAFYSMADLSHFLWTTKKEGEEKKDA